MKPKIALFSLCAFVAGAFLSFYLMGPDSSPVQKDKKASFIKGGDFTLFESGSSPDQSIPFSLNQLKGRPVILYFGYTHCPDVCPVGLGVIRDALNASKEFENIIALFITLDPERDNIDILKQYVQFFHKNIKGLSGSVDEIKAVSDQYGAYFITSTHKAGEQGYTLDHTTYFYLIDDRGELVRVLDHDTQAKELAEELSKLL